ncbi:hypothetical protein KFL_000080300 [Klebsormidium nitens]|uniref:Calcineurin-like phosphoesterase domain-containing protein n=1 Tax=Klebsormidium nitens TaxID=105231 RepID=A0A1Y1HNE1_KLENI|nr:hypothetical protein KFL_000080300 [Klebsormidium nitens]|eukprot:GAQ78126.1 hypothetical protein KFL_000080300 [Klebsormidium nitens]
MSGRRVRIAIIGDVHEVWDADIDRRALESLEVDLTLFVGDFGEQKVELVQAVSELPVPKAVILGNHDAWLPFGPKKEDGIDGVQQQLDLLGECHVGYGRLDFPDLQLSVVGGRPFSSGGTDWESSAAYSKKRYGYTSFDESARAIAQQALAAPRDDTLIVMAHNGPTGLGDRPEDICGRDFGRPAGGDYGDPDLQIALDLVRAAGRDVPLVTFGHMHQILAHGKGERKLLVNNPSTGTVYLNTAIVPRVKDVWSGQDDEGSPVKCRDCRNFFVVEMEDSRVRSVQELWVSVSPGEKPACIVSRQELLIETV